MDQSESRLQKCSLLIGSALWGQNSQEKVVNLHLYALSMCQHQILIQFTAAPYNIWGSSCGSKRYVISLIALWSPINLLHVYINPIRPSPHHAIKHTMLPPWFTWKTRCSLQHRCEARKDDIKEMSSAWKVVCSDKRMTYVWIISTPIQTSPQFFFHKADEKWKKMMDDEEIPHADKWAALQLPCPASLLVWYSYFSIAGMRWILRYE